MHHTRERNCSREERRSYYVAPPPPELLRDGRWKDVARVGVVYRKVVFLDETWAKTNRTRTYGRCLRGTRLMHTVPDARWSTTTFLGSLRSTGFIAPLCVDGAINGRVFKTWVEQHLVLRCGRVTSS